MSDGFQPAPTAISALPSPLMSPLVIDCGALPMVNTGPGTKAPSPRPPKICIASARLVDEPRERGSVSVTAMSILRLLPMPPARIADGRIEFDGNDMAGRHSRSDMAALRRRMQMIFQDPFSSLNPRWRVFDIIAEPIRAFGLSTGKADLEARVAAQGVTAEAKAKGAKRAILLPVSAPFHCSLMAPAAEVMALALENVAINQPAVPLVANVVAQAVTDPAEIRSLLVKQVTGSVRWRESVMYMAANGVTEVYEIGAGKALSGMIKRIDRDVATSAVGTPEDVVAAAAALQ